MQGTGLSSPATDGQAGLADAWYILTTFFFSMVWAERIFPGNCSVILGRGKGTLYGFEEPISCLKLARSGLSNSVKLIYVMSQ